MTTTRARCRGSDLQLRPQAVALLTLGPGICKDKLMQAAGRLRQLRPGRQTLRVVGVPDVTAKIWVAAAASGPTSRAAAAQRGPEAHQRQQRPGMVEVLRWVMANTVEALLKGVPEWAGKGLHFATAGGPPDRALLDETHELQQLYGSGKQQQPVAAVVDAMARQQLGRFKGYQPGQQDLQQAQRLVLEVQRRSSACGQGRYLVAGLGAADEECERELEKEEEEEEQEQEVQVPGVAPAEENDWTYSAALQAASAAQLARSCAALQLVPLPRAAQLLAPEAVGQVPWSGAVFCTANCIYTTQLAMAAAQQGGAPGLLNEYLRPLDAALLLPSGEVVLLSERELDGLLEVLWAGGGGAGGSVVALLSLRYANRAFPQRARPKLAASLKPAGRDLLSRLAASELVSVQLFNGAATYEGQEQQGELVRMVRGRMEAAEALVAMRGALPLFPRSDLQKACDGYLLGGE